MDLFNTKCEEYFDHNNIPYKKSVDIDESLKERIIVDYVIPGAVIRIMTPHHIDRKWCIRIERMLLHIPKNITLYILFQKPLTASQIDELVEFDRVKIIMNIEDIKPLIHNYYIINTAFIKYLGSQLNTDHEKDLERFKHITLYTSQHTYDMATIIMNPTELERVKKFNIQIREEINNNMIVFNNESSMNKKVKKYTPMDPVYKRFYYFVIKWTIYFLESAVPSKHIEGITGVCPQCQCIYFLDLFKGDICIKCEKLEKVTQKVE